jgi:polyisoprenoid-binding protein YceI
MTSSQTQTRIPAGTWKSDPIHSDVGFAVRHVSDGIVVEGDLTLKDTTKAVEARGRVTEPLVGPDGKERIGLDLETTVDRNEIGLDWNAPLPEGGMLLGDQVAITVHLELVKED